MILALHNKISSGSSGYCIPVPLRQVAAIRRLLRTSPVSPAILFPRPVFLPASLLEGFVPIFREGVRPAEACARLLLALSNLQGHYNAAYE